MSSLSSSSSALPQVCAIELRRESLSRYTTDRYQGFRLRVTCTDSPCTIDKNLFVYQRFTCPAEEDVFVAVASPTDFEEYPVYVPGSDLGGALFNRRDSIDLVFRSMLTLEEAWKALVSDVSELSRTLQGIQDSDLTESETIRVIGPLELNYDFDHYCVRSGMITGTGGTDYTVQFIPPFTKPPVVSLAADSPVYASILVPPTQYSVRIRTSKILDSSSKVYWTAIGY